MAISKQGGPQGPRGPSGDRRDIDDRLAEMDEAIALQDEAIAARDLADQQAAQQDEDVRTGTAVATQPAYQPTVASSHSFYDDTTDSDPAFPGDPTAAFPTDPAATQPTNDGTPPQARTRDEFIQRVMANGKFDEETGELQEIPYAEAAAAVDAELGKQDPVDLSAIGDGSNTISQIGESEQRVQNTIAGSERGEAVNLVTMAGTINRRLTNMFDEDTLFTLPENEQLKSFLVNNALIEGGKISPNVGNALALAIGKVAQDVRVRKDSRDSRSRDLDEALKSGDPADDGFRADEVSGELIREMMNLISPSEGDGGYHSTPYGGRHVNMSDGGTRAMASTVWEVMHDMGFLDIVQPDPKREAYWRLGQEAEAYMESIPHVLKSVFPNSRLHPSLVPLVSGKDPGGHKSSVVSKTGLPENVGHQDEVKDYLGRMPNQINIGRLEWLTALYREVYSGTDPDSGAPYLNRVTNVSNHPQANVFRMGPERYRVFLSKQLMNAPLSNMTEKDAHKEASNIMAREWKKIELTLLKEAPGYTTRSADGRVVGKKFYNKWYHAASNGRFGILNTVMNSQDSKLVRGFVESGVSARVIVGSNSVQEKNAKYIISRHLMPKDEGIDVRNAPHEEVRGIFNKYIDSWAHIGRKIRDGGEAKDAAIKTIIDSLGGKAHEDWGYKTQAYIDAANYKDAGDNGTDFIPKGLIQFDGKQNGPAIQATQAGDVSIMLKTGVIPDEYGEFQPDGDIRDAFVMNMDNSIGITFIGPDHKAEIVLEAWQNLSPDRKSAFAKQPILETGYGKWHEYHILSVLEFLRDPKNASFTRTIMDAFPEDYPQDLFLARDLAGAVSESLRFTLDLQATSQTNVYKKVGMFWSLLGNSTPTIAGPNGEPIMFGSRTFVPKLGPDDMPVRRQIRTKEGGTIDYKEGRVQAGSQGAPDPKAALDNERLEMIKIYQRTGSTPPNQFPVLSVQHVDAAIIGHAIVQVNRRMNPREVPPFVIPIHDAIITDAHSMHLYHTQINNSFIEINDRYRTAVEMEKGIKLAYDAWKSKINPNSRYVFHPDYGDYRVLFTYIQEIHERVEAQKAGGLTVDNIDELTVIMKARGVPKENIARAIVKMKAPKKSDGFSSKELSEFERMLRASGMNPIVVKHLMQKVMNGSFDPSTYRSDQSFLNEAISLGWVPEDRLSTKESSYINGQDLLDLAHLVDHTRKVMRGIKDLAKKHESKYKEARDRVEQDLVNDYIVSQYN